MQTIAARLGFDLVSHRLELFGSRRKPKRDAAAEPRAPGGGRSPEVPGHPPVPSRSADP